MTNGIDKDSLWKQYQLYVDLYKHYLDLVIKFNVFYYAVTGGILSFYFSKIDVTFIRYSLLFPILLSFGISAFFFYGASLVKVMREDIVLIGKALRLYSFPEVKILAILLYLSASLFLFVAVCLVVLFFLRKS